MFRLNEDKRAAMAFNQILVPLNGSDRDEIALTTAFSIAKYSNAHVFRAIRKTGRPFRYPCCGLSLVAGFDCGYLQIHKADCGRNVAHGSSSLHDGGDRGESLHRRSSEG